MCVYDRRPSRYIGFDRKGPPSVRPSNPQRKKQLNDTNFDQISGGGKDGDGHALTDKPAAGEEVADEGGWGQDRGVGGFRQ